MASNVRSLGSLSVNNSKSGPHYGWLSFVTTEAFWQAFYFPT